MNDFDEAMRAAIMPVPGSTLPADRHGVFAALPIADLASLWCALQHVSVRDQDEKTWSAIHYFDRLPHDEPERALALVLAVLAAETDKRVLMQLNGRLMTALVHAHADRLVDRIEEEARRNETLRWLLGGAHCWAADDTLRARLARSADDDAWRRDQEARDTPARPIDYATLSTAQLARAWVEQRAKPEKDTDDNWHALADYERDLVAMHPDAVIDLVVEILRIESNPNLLSLLAAGLLEDAISMPLIERIEREAEDPRFRRLLAGVWYHDKDAALKGRLDAILGRS